MSIADARTYAEDFDSEADLVARAKAGDAAVWSLWHDRFYPVLYRYAAARLHSQEDAEDVASQVFVEALKGIGRYSYRGKPILAWLYGIAAHLVSRRFRDNARTTNGLDAVELEGASGDQEATLRSLELRMALERLKSDHKEVLVLRFLIDLPTKEVAAILGKTEAATHSLQVRAVEALRRELRQ